jgi:hypothetical protein
MWNFNTCICNSTILEISMVGLLENSRQLIEAQNFTENDENVSG